jgi:hypothetical protein
MTKDQTESPMPRVRQHPEVIECLRRLGSDEIDVTAAFEQLREVVENYIRPPVSEARAQILGHALVAEVFPSPQQAKIRAEFEAIWRQAHGDPPCEAPVAHTLAAVLVSACLMSKDARVFKAEQRLYAEKLKSVLPKAIIY